MGRRRVSIQGWVYPEVKQRLKELSERTRIPMSAMIERCIELSIIEYEEREEVYGEHIDKMIELEKKANAPTPRQQPQTQEGPQEEAEGRPQGAEEEPEKG